MKIQKIVLSFMLVVVHSFVGAMESNDYVNPLTQQSNLEKICAAMYGQEASVGVEDKSKPSRYFKKLNGEVKVDNRWYNEFDVPCDTPSVQYYPVSSKPKNIESHDSPTSILRELSPDIQRRKNLNVASTVVCQTIVPSFR